MTLFCFHLLARDEDLPITRLLLVFRVPVLLSTSPGFCCWVWWVGLGQSHDINFQSLSFPMDVLVSDVFIFGIARWPAFFSIHLFSQSTYLGISRS